MRSRLLERLPPAGRCFRRTQAAGSMARNRSPPAARLPHTLKDEPHPQVDLAFGFLIVKPPPMLLSTKSTSAP